MRKENESNLSKLKKEYESVSMGEEAIHVMRQRMEQGKKEKKIMKMKTWMKGVAVAAAVALVILPNTSSSVAYAMKNIPLLGNVVNVVTFRDYHYDQNKKTADVSVSKIDINTEGLEGESVDNAKKSSEEINREIEQITNQWVEEFKETMSSDGYEQIMVKTEPINTTDKYFTLKLICYQGAGSGYEQDFFYTINLDTGKRMKLSDLFIEGSDYRTIISDDIKKQMREQMDEDENVSYWLDDKEVEEWNFEEIPEDVSFYVNENNELVICFNEGDVAPMYMGTVEFVISNEILGEIRK